MKLLFLAWCCSRLLRFVAYWLVTDGIMGIDGMKNSRVVPCLSWQIWAVSSYPSWSVRLFSVHILVLVGTFGTSGSQLNAYKLQDCFHAVRPSLTWPQTYVSEWRQDRYGTESRRRVWRYVYFTYIWQFQFSNFRPCESREVIIYNRHADRS